MNDGDPLSRRGSCTRSSAGTSPPRRRTRTRSHRPCMGSASRRVDGEQRRSRRRTRVAETPPGPRHTDEAPTPVVDHRVRRRHRPRGHGGRDPRGRSVRHRRPGSPRTRRSPRRDAWPVGVHRGRGRAGGRWVLLLSPTTSMTPNARPEPGRGTTTGALAALQASWRTCGTPSSRSRCNSFGQARNRASLEQSPTCRRTSDRAGVS